MVLCWIVVDVWKYLVLEYNGYTLGLYEYPFGERNCVEVKPRGSVFGQRVMVILSAQYKVDHVI